MDNLANELKGLRFNGRRCHLALFRPYEKKEVKLSGRISRSSQSKKKKTSWTMERQDFKGSQASEIQGNQGVL